jgi:hypothetical protein
MDNKSARWRRISRNQGKIEHETPTSNQEALRQAKQGP